MKDLHTTPNEHLEARITAWVLGQASPFEAAELEALCAADPELQLFLNRTKALHSLLLETPPSTSDQFWKLSPENRAKLDPIIGPNSETHSTKNPSIRRAAYCTAFGIAAVLAVTVFIKRFIFISPSMDKESHTIVAYSMESDELYAPAAAEELSIIEKRSDGKQRSVALSSPRKPAAPSSSAVIPAPASEQALALAERNSDEKLSGGGGGGGPENIMFRLKLDDASEDRENKDIATSAMAKVIAAASDSPVAIPVPDVNVTEPSLDFGDGEGFGGGWGGAKSNAVAGKNDGGIGYGSGAGGQTDISNTFLATEALTATDDAFASNDSQNKGEFKYQPGSPNNEGLRSGNDTLERNSIDGILSQTDRDTAAKKGNAQDTATQAPVGGISFSENGLAQREIARRQNNITEADRNLVEGREAYAKGDYAQAADKYKEALGALPDTPAPALEDRRKSYSQHLSDASVAQAQQMRKVGKYDEARELLEQAETLSPTDATIKNELGYLNDPIRTNPAGTYEHTDKVDEVRRKLYIAQGNYDLGKYDDAKKSYEDILRIDPNNSAARRGMEKIAGAKNDYYRAAYDHTRAELLMEIDKAWELAVPAEGEENADPFAAAPVDGVSVDTHSENFNPKKKGATASIEVIREFIYPNEYEPPVPGNVNPAASDPFLELTKEGKDQLAQADFEGFANYGSPILDKPISVKTTTKYVEVTQENNKELGFDWSAINLEGTISSGHKINIPVTPAFPTILPEASEGKIALLEDLPHIGRLFKDKPSLIDLSNELSATEEVFSTFSLNISDASFQLALAAIEKGERPDPASIKPEQFYNAIDYGDPAPSASEPVAAAIDQTAHPVIPGRNLVRVALRTASTGRSAAQPLRLTLLVDQSGSMVRADRRIAMETALAQLATLLTEHDRITVIGFSRTPHLLAQSLPGNEAGKLPDIINQTASEGGTNLEQAINLASELALRHQLDGAQNRIVLFTDGAANLGDADPDRLSDKIKDLRQQGLAFDIAGIGTNDLNDQLLSGLARHGNGRYYLVGEKTGGNLAAQLAGAFRPAAENVKVQVKLNPQRVGNYKLIGFEKDRLKTEDFRNDAVDAAELAADEAGVALYQVETLPEGTGEIGEVSVRFRDTASGEMVERTWTIPYDASAPSFDKANPKTQLATLALLAAQKLQTGPMADAIDFSNYSETIAKLKQANSNSNKTQQLLNLINALK